jgi:ketosteroid isomerase-like protein
MRSVLAPLLAFVLLAASASPAAAQAPSPGRPALPSVTLPPALDRVLRDYERAWVARDAAGLAAIFAADGFVLANGEPPVRGRPAIQAAYASSGGALALRALHYATGDTVGYIVGTFAAGASQPPQGKFVLALRRSPGGPWQIAADIDNLDSRPRPRPAAAAAARADSAGGRPTTNPE